jgi:N-acetyl sugar amidotransferase
MRGYNVTPYRQCSQCIMDTNDDPFLKFDDKGICNHCVTYVQEEKEFVKSGQEGERELQSIIDKIKADGKGKKYDCVLGISGGVDSSYLAYVAKEWGIRPLGVHCDNGWNSELAVQNIQSIVRTLDMDLDTYVINWDEFRDIQLAYLKANVIDIEAITDLAFRAVLKRTAHKYKVKYFLSGDNVVTESVLPRAWICKDTSNLVSIHEKYGCVPLKTYPLMTPLKELYYDKTNPTESLALLNLMDYKKDHVKEVIKTKLGWRDYGGKHFESVFTRFYQAYILPNKFGVDKRKAHLSNLICSGQITKAEALEELKEVYYPDEMMRIDKEFVLKKLGFSEQAFEEYMKADPILHEHYGIGKTIYDRYKVLKLIRPIVNLIKN